jgi:transcription termination factor NusB
MTKQNKQGGRSRARELIVQTLYQKQITGHDVVELLRQFHDRPDYKRVDKKYYDEALKEICENRESI